MILQHPFGNYSSFEELIVEAAQKAGINYTENPTIECDEQNTPIIQPYTLTDLLEIQKCSEDSISEAIFSRSKYSSSDVFLDDGELIELLQTIRGTHHTSNPPKTPEFFHITSQIFPHISKQNIEECSTEGGIFETIALFYPTQAYLHAREHNIDFTKAKISVNQEHRLALHIIKQTKKSIATTKRPKIEKDTPREIKYEMHNGEPYIPHPLWEDASNLNPRIIGSGGEASVEHMLNILRVTHIQDTTNIRYHPLSKAIKRPHTSTNNHEQTIRLQNLKKEGTIYEILRDDMSHPLPGIPDTQLDEESNTLISEFLQTPLIIPNIPPENTSNWIETLKEESPGNFSEIFFGLTDQLIRILTSLRLRKIIHGDIKEGNIIGNLNPMQTFKDISLSELPTYLVNAIRKKPKFKKHSICSIDFGISDDFNSPKFLPIANGHGMTQGYVDLSYFQNDFRATHLTDVYACGVVLRNILTREFLMTHTPNQFQEIHNLIKTTKQIYTSLMAQEVQSFRTKMITPTQNSQELTTQVNQLTTYIEKNDKDWVRACQMITSAMDLDPQIPNIIRYTTQKPFERFSIVPETAPQTATSEQVIYAIKKYL